MRTETGDTVTGSSVRISIGFRQSSNPNAGKVLTSPDLTSDSSFYCFAIDPDSLNLPTIGGFDYSGSAAFRIGKGLLTVGTTSKPGTDNDYQYECFKPTPGIYYSKSSGDLHDLHTWGINQDGSGTNPPADFSGTFNLANRPSNYPPAAYYYMTGDWTISGFLNMPYGSQLLLNGFTLSERGIFGEGTLVGSPTSSLIINRAQDLDFDITGRELKNLTINTYSGSETHLKHPDYPFADLPFNLYGTFKIIGGPLTDITPKGGTLVVDRGNLVLKSTDTSSAVVAPLPITGIIAGNVTAEQYIPARRAWRLINAPVGGSQTIHQAWQTDYFSGTYISGGATYGSTANGFDQIPNSNSSLLVYDNPSNQWLPIPNTNATPVGKTPFMLFPRGYRDNVTHQFTDNSLLTYTILQATGPLLTGNQTYQVKASGFTAVPNPYQTPINFATITRTNVQNNFYVWDPKMGGTYGRGAYVTVSWNGNSYDVVPTPVSPESQYIQPWQSFMVRSTGAAGSLTIKESDKAIGGLSGNVFRTASNNGNAVSGNAPADHSLQEEGNLQSIRIGLKAANANDTSLSLVDEVLVTYSSIHSNKVDDMDAVKMSNFNENLSLIRSDQQLTIERRALMQQQADTLFLSLSNTQQKGYLFQFIPSNLVIGNKTAYLEDAYLHTAIPIDVSITSQIPFTINADAASQSSSRFKIVFASTKVQPVDNRMEINTYPNPLVDRTINLQLANQPRGSYQVTLINNSGQVLFSGKIQHEGGSVTHRLNMSHMPAAGAYQLQVTGNTGVNTTLKMIIK